MPQLFFRPKYVWFSVHLKGPMIPDPSDQLAEPIVYITSTRVDLYSHQILLDTVDRGPYLTNAMYSFVVQVSPHDKTSKMSTGYQQAA